MALIEKGADAIDMPVITSTLDENWLTKQLNSFGTLDANQPDLFS